MSLEVRIKKRLQSFTLAAEFTADCEIFGLLGESGAGKSILLKCIAGIEKPDEGRIALNGRVLYDSGMGIDLPPQKRRVGYLFQEHALFPHMTAEENVMMGMRERRSREAAGEWLRSVRLDGLEDRLPDQLSGGQKQRVAVARMLASEPECILFDEPFSSLGSAMKWDLENEMRSRLKEMHRPVIYVSHDPAEAYRMCGRVCCIKDGKTEMPRSREDFFYRPSTVAAAELAGVSNISPVTRNGSDGIRADLWNIRVEAQISGDTTYLGIRPDSLRTNPPGDVAFRIAEAEPVGDLGGYIVRCRPEGSECFLKWDPGAGWTGERPENLYADWADILELK